LAKPVQTVEPSNIGFATNVERRFKRFSAKPQVKGIHHVSISFWAAGSLRFELFDGSTVKRRIG
jgi:hypothetical protein